MGVLISILTAVGLGFLVVAAVSYGVAALLDWASTDRDGADEPL